MAEIRIAGVEAIGKHTLRVQWASEKTTVIDLSEPIARLKGLRPLRDAAVFARAAVGEGGHSVVWPDERDMGADRLWEMALEQNGRADAAQFIRWRWKNNLSLTAAAEALGISRRQVAYYASGDEAVPRYILLACKGWEAGRRAA
ncbi:MAG TPA: hypothetical protein VGP20_02825 [Steroidobacteraceae bacterium]|jgi:hypothetical protein|nr:hypothetical protein [Steroidobacteraceae bacterium]